MSPLGPPSTSPQLIAGLLAYGVARVVIMFTAMWNDENFSFRVGSLLRHNMLDRIYELPGAQAIEDSPSIDVVAHSVDAALEESEEFRMLWEGRLDEPDWRQPAPLS